MKIILLIIIENNIFHFHANFFGLLEINLNHINLLSGQNVIILQYIKYNFIKNYSSNPLFRLQLIQISFSMKFEFLVSSLNIYYYNLIIFHRRSSKLLNHNDNITHNDKTFVIPLYIRISLKCFRFHFLIILNGIYTYYSEIKLKILKILISN